MNIAGRLRRVPRKAMFRFAAECLVGCGGVFLLALIGSVGRLKSSTEGFLLLLFVAAIAIGFGFWQATAACIVGALCLDYLFLPPVFVLTITDPQDWVALGAFEISAVVVSWLSSKEKRNASEAKRQRAGMVQLYELSRSTLLLDLHEPPGPQLTQLINRIFDVEAVALFDANLGRLDTIGSWAMDEQNLAKDCYMLDMAHEDGLTHTSLRVLRLDGNSIGAFAVRGEISDLVVSALESLAVISLERFRSFEKENRAEAAQQSEQLRTAVLDSLAHAFKTPLTAIHAAGSGLLEAGQLNPSQRELASLIEEESVNLNKLCTRLLQTARLESEQLSHRKENVIVSQLISTTVAEQAGKAADHQVEVSISDPALAVCGDPDLLAMILVQYLDNAAKYSSPSSPIKISARESRSEVLISVHNEGSAIRIGDRDRIFERFYRSPDAERMASGTGIGLSVVRKVAEAHRGHVWVISDEIEGTTFYLSLPQAPGGSH